MNASGLPEPTPSPQRRTARRVLLLCLCLGLGLAAGFIGYHYTADEAWFLAVPVCLGIGWFMVADPTACTPREPARDRDRRAH